MDKTKIERDSFIYNTAGGMLNAFQSVFILMAISRKMTMDDAGVFTLAYSVANLMLMIGKYGMRNYQVTDTLQKYSMRKYFISRVITTVVMVAAGLIYVLYKRFTQPYTDEKAWIIFLMCVMKAVDSIEDVYHGKYQQAGRLDIAGKCMTVHMLAIIVSFVLCICFGGSVLAATALTTAVSLFVTIVTIRFANMTFGNRVKDGAAVKSDDSVHTLPMLLKDCFPLFLATFIGFYQINAPKYSIDSFMTNVDQANFGFISMPVFFASLICQFLYLPVLNGMAVQYQKEEADLLKKSVRKQSFLILGAVVLIILGAGLLGIPFLSILYSTDLSGLKQEFYVLMLGSGALAYGNFLMSVLTIFRRQNMIMTGYLITTAAEIIAMNKAVRLHGIMGGSVVFSLTAALLMVYLFIAMLAVFAGFERGIKHRNPNSISE
ncbi:MAG: hypothetical protein K6C99_05080 [Lachnospiraceae bacterium]|nr:hypothetical protein [Lachnospiraceae bacterium]